jgi:hypothetical protein
MDAPTDDQRVGGACHEANDEAQRQRRPSMTRRKRLRLSRGIIAALILLVVSAATAQDRIPPVSVRDAIKNVALDPTTYAPAIVAWEAMRLDWRSSQVFFERGWVEQNPRFTISGRAGDIAIPYAAGNRLILKDAFANLRVPLVHNVSERVVEHLLQTRYPNHRRLLRAAGWTERLTMASILSYRRSAEHSLPAVEGQRAPRPTTRL